MALRSQVLAIIKAEITNDPENRGYAGKTNAQIALLLNEPYTVDTIVKVQRAARINVILNQIADTANIVADTDVTDAKAAP